MERQPFDPSRVRTPPPAEDGLFESGGEEPLSVSALAGLIKSTLERRIPSPVRVVGQVSNLARPNHWYFSLKDEDAVVSCVAWASTARKIGFVPEDGDEVLATGHVSHYAPQGRTQFYVSALAPIGAGALQLRFQAMCETLRGLGYFDEDRKQPLPPLPRRIAVITSAGGAAIHDVVDTAAKRCRAVGLLVVDVRVQGDGAAGEIARAIRAVDANRDRLGVDAILVTRGGGSIEDLWAFNERVVADAAFACTLPLVAAIGHESDTTVIELVADLRAATPTQAAMHLVPSADELLRQVDHLSDRMTAGVRARINRERIRLERCATRLAHLRPERVLAARSERIAVLAQRLREAARRRIDRRPLLAALGGALHRAVAQRVRRSAERLDALGRELAAVDPRRVLARGFSYTTTPDGALVRSVADVGPGDGLLTHVADGSIESVVRDSRARAGPTSRRSGGRGDREKADQMDLFRPGG